LRGLSLVNLPAGPPSTYPEGLAAVFMWSFLMDRWGDVTLARPVGGPGSSGTPVRVGEGADSGCDMVCIPERASNLLSLQMDR
jgi:hypothetical protein